MPNELSAKEETAFEKDEAIIRENLPGFIAVGGALMRIRDGKLYRAGYKTFEIYCEHKWKLSKSRAYQLIESAQVTQNLSTPGGRLPMPENEKVTRPLAALPPPEQKKAWKSAVKSANGQHPSTKQVKEAVDDLPDIEDAPKEVLKDPDGWQVPERAVAAIQFAPTIKTWCRTLDTLKREIGEACEERKPGTRYVLLATCESMLKQIKQTLWASIPEYVCPYCNGELKECKTCAGEGWVNGSTHYSGKSQREIAS